MKTKSIFAGLLMAATSLLNAQLWSSLGDPEMNGGINTIAVDNTNKIYVAGNFSYGLNSDGKSYVARYNYLDWEDVGSFGANGAINKIILDSSSNIYAVGEFKNSTGKYYVAKYNGTSWGSTGNLISTSTIKDIVTDGTNIYAAGLFTNTTTGQTYYVSKWDGTSWSPVDNGNLNGIVHSLSFNNGTLYIAGEFKNTLGYYCVYKYSNSTWSEVGKIRSAYPIYKVVADNEGRVYAQHSYLNGSYPSGVLSRYLPSSNTWSYVHYTSTNVRFSDASNATYVYAGACTSCGGQFTVFNPYTNTNTDYWASTGGGINGMNNELVMDNYGYLLTPAKVAGGINNVNPRFGVIKSSNKFLATSETTAKSKITIYPNPSTGIVNISNKEKISSVEVYDTTGKLVQKSQPNSDKAQVNLTGNKGIFMVKSTSESGTDSQKVIIK